MDIGRFKFVLFLFLAGCADEYVKVEPSVQRYVDIFYSEANARNVFPEHNNLKIVMDYSMTDYQALSCDNHVIRLNAHIFNDMFSHRLARDSAYMGVIIFHELGHSVLGRPHCSQLSVMNAGQQGDFFRVQGIYATCEDCRKTMFDELFSPGNQLQELYKKMNP